MPLQVCSPATASLTVSRELCNVQLECEVSAPQFCGTMMTVLSEKVATFRQLTVHKRLSLELPARRLSVHNFTFEDINPELSKASKTRSPLTIALNHFNVGGLPFHQNTRKRFPQSHFVNPTDTPKWH
jgi:hypothetical protein